MSQPGDPLDAQRRQGTVTAITTGPPSTVTVQLASDDGTGDKQDFPFLDSYYPTVGDTVMMLSVGGDHFVLGMPAANTTPYLSIGWAGHTINTGANQVAFGLTDPWGGWDGTNNQWTVPRRGLYACSGVWRYNAAHAVSASDLFLNGARYLQGPYDNGAIDTGPQWHIVAAFAAGDVLSVRASVGGTGAAFANYFTVCEVGRL